MIVPSTHPTCEQVARHYDDLDVWYREIWGDHLHHGLWLTGDESPGRAVEQMVERVAELAQIAAGQKVCDVGCGYGATARMLTERFGADVTGFTISEAQYCYAVAKASDRLRFVLHDWLDNHIPDGSFDAIVSIECASHIQDKHRWMSEMHRTLRPGGRVAFAAWLCHPQAAAWQRRYLLEPICREGRLAGLATLDEYRHIAETSGFRVLHCERISRAVRRTWSICARRLITGLITHPRYVKVLFDRSNANRIFAITLFRIMEAYRCGAMQYGLFSLCKPDTARL